MAMEAIRRHADEFPFWQRRVRPGRPATEERTLLIAFMLQQLLDLTFRETEGLLGLVQQYYSIVSVPDHSTLCRKMSSRRWSIVMDRFAKHILASLPKRQAVVATDATGYSGRKRGWNETPYHRRVREDWLKVHAAIDVGEFIVLAYTLTESNVHESQVFKSVWEGLPSNVRPVRSLADAVYCSEAVLATAREHGATPLHAIKTSARNFEGPET